LLGIFGYFGTAMFLHLSYQRYYWFLMALAGAALLIFEKEAAKSLTTENRVTEKTLIPARGDSLAPTIGASL
jgi:hypothetical protein